jgi:hypothetical protein
VLGLLVVLVVLVIYQVYGLFFKPPPPQLAQQVAVAAQPIEPFTVIAENMVKVITATADIKAETIEESLQTYAVHDAEGKVCMKMARQPIKANQPILQSVLLDYCFEKQPEIISLPARFSEMVGGQLKPLHRINIWGYHGGSQAVEGMILIASNVLVVDVRTASGEDATTSSLSQTGGGGGLGLGDIAGEGTEPASIVTVAAEPEEVQQIVSYLGAQGFQAWVTLTGEDVWIAPTSTPIPSTPTPISTPTGPTPSPPTPTSTPTPGPRPDLYVVNITTDPSPLVVDQLGTVRVEVSNRGLMETVTASWTGLYIDRPAQADPDQQMFCPPLGVDENESAVISYTVTFADVGYHALTAWVDLLEAIPEENETNNQSSASILVVSPTPTPTPTFTPTPTPTPTLIPTSTEGSSTSVIHLGLENTPYQWQLDVVFDDGVNPVSTVSAAEIQAAGAAYWRDFYTRELTLTVTNVYPAREDVWIIRTDEDDRASVDIQGHSKDEEGRDMFEWGKEGTVVIRSIGGATEATVTLLDSVVGG